MQHNIYVHVNCTLVTFGSDSMQMFRWVVLILPVRLVYHPSAGITQHRHLVETAVLYGVVETPRATNVSCGVHWTQFPVVFK